MCLMNGILHGRLNIIIHPIAMRKDLCVLKWMLVILFRKDKQWNSAESNRGLKTVCFINLVRVIWLFFIQNTFYLELETIICNTVGLYHRHKNNVRVVQPFSMRGQLYTNLHGRRKLTAASLVRALIHFHSIQLRRLNLSTIEQLGCIG